MDVNDFREFGRAAIDFVADYIENIRDKDVLPSVNPGYLHALIPGEVPEKPENWKDVLEDINRVIVPGLTHWQSPNFHAYYPTQTSYPSIIGELIADGFGIVGFSWICSPACTELEVAVMDWLGKFLNLPRHFLHCNEGPGGGIIQGSASESIFVAVLAAREQAVRRILKERSDLTEAEIRGRLVAYSSDQSNSAIEKAGILSAVPVRLLPVDDDCSLRGEVLQAAINEDLAQGRIPCICIATLGTTGTCAYDNLKEIGPICQQNKMWFHIDAAYAGAALCCPEFSYLLQGVEMADSFNFNLHKWMMVNFDCGAMFLRNANLVTESFNVDRIYLKHQYQGLAMAPDYRHWQIPLGRRFRSLKVWITLRTIGAENIRNNIRQHCKLAKIFEERVRSDDRFEIVKPARMGLVCFRLKGECLLSKTLLQQITDNKKIYMIPATFKDKFLIRFVVCGQRPDISDIDYAWNVIKDHANILYNINLNNNNTDINFNDITNKISAIDLKQTSNTFADKCDKNKVFSTDISSVTFENNEKCK